MKTGLYPLPSRPDQRGARDRHERGTGMRWTRKLRLTSAADAYGKDVWSRRRGAGVNAPGGDDFPGRNGGKRAVLRGEHAISRKAIAQGRPDALRWTCMLVCALFVHIAHETAGAARTRSSLRPLTTEGEEFPANLGRNASRDREGVSASLRAKRRNPCRRTKKEWIASSLCSSQ